MNIKINDNRQSRIQIDGKGDIDISFIEMDRGIPLNLTPEEGTVLNDILESIGGDPDKSSRGIADSIRKKIFEYSKLFEGVVKEKDLKKEKYGLAIYYKDIES
jgi:hypothetical protein